MTLFFANHQITIYRNRRKGTALRWGMSATFTGYDADIQPASSTRLQQFPNNFGALYSAFVDASVDIKEGDQVHTEDGKVYGVKGVQRWNDGNSLAEVDHLELVLVAQDA